MLYSVTASWVFGTPPKSVVLVPLNVPVDRTAKYGLLCSIFVAKTTARPSFKRQLLDFHSIRGKGPLLTMFLPTKLWGLKHLKRTVYCQRASSLATGNIGKAVGMNCSYAMQSTRQILPVRHFMRLKQNQNDLSVIHSWPGSYSLNCFE